MILALLKYVLYFILIIIAIVVLTGFYIFIRNVYDRIYFNRLFSKPSSLVYTLPNGVPYSLDTWMSNVNPSTPINKLVIPGTHDSLTYEWEKSYSIIQQFTAIWAKTQYLTTKQQLMSGVRYFDARCGSSDSKYGYGTDTVVVFHGDFSTNIKYEESINELIEFINTHPSEIIIWKVRILNNGDIVRPITTKYHSQLNLIPYTSSYFNSSLEELRSRRPDKNRGGVILVSGHYGEDPTIWTDSKIFDPYDFGALMTDKKSFTMSKPHKTDPSPSPSPSVAALMPSLSSIDSLSSPSLSPSLSPYPSPSPSPSSSSIEAPRFKMSMNKIYSNKEVDPTSVSVMQMIAEYQTSTKTSLLDSIETISKRINKAIIDKDMPPPPKTGYNIIMIDFLTPQLSNGIIQFNQPPTFIAIK